MTTIYETTGKGNKQQGDYVLPNIGIDDVKTLAEKENVTEDLKKSIKKFPISHFSMSAYLTSVTLPISLALSIQVFVKSVFANK